MYFFKTCYVSAVVMMLLSVLVLCLVYVTAHATSGRKIASTSDQLFQSAESDRKLSQIRAELARIERLATQSSGAGGSVYVRWGGRKCPDSAETLYSGVIGGSFYTHVGAAANALCLPLNPVYDGHPLPRETPMELHGAEYQVSPESKYQQDPLCAVCVSPRPHTVMIPATNTCHPGWTVEYTGYLMAGEHISPAASEFICMDANMDARVDSQDSRNGYLFYYTVGKCGSLPCPPYEDNKIITCVVCSK